MTQLVVWGPAELTDRLDEVIYVYGQAMGYPSDLLVTRRNYMGSHVHRPDFRAVASLDDDGQLLGFGYGYRSEPGQWWHDQVRAAMRREARAYWLADCFEVVELHVLPRAQGHGLGANQLRRLLDLASARRQPPEKQYQPSSPTQPPEKQYLPSSPTQPPEKQYLPSSPTQPPMTTLLSTPEADETQSRAWRLYRRFGFVDVVRHFMFPGDVRPFAILGRTLPLGPLAR